MRAPSSIAVLLLLAACEPVTHDMRGEAALDGDEACEEGAETCADVQTLAVCVDGGWATTACDEVCAPGLGCVACVPGLRSCRSADVVVECDADGGALAEVARCSGGERCVAGECATGGCVGLEATSLGCELWALDLDNAESSFRGIVTDRAAGGQVVVGVVNPDETETAHVTVEIDQADPGEASRLLTLETAAVGPGGSHLFTLPRRDVDGESVVDGHDDGEQTGLTRRSYRLSSSRPVAAFQWNPIDDAACTGASLLLPLRGLGRAYHVVDYLPAAPLDPLGIGFGINRPYVTIVGTEAGTVVRVTPAYDVLGGGGVPPLAAGEVYETILDAFDVLNLEADEPPGLFAPPPDLTGTVVTASAPVAVFSGVDSALVPQHPISLPGDDEALTSCCGDHIEEQLPPDSTLGRRYAVARSPIRSRGYVEPDYLRVVAAGGPASVTTSLGEGCELEEGASCELEVDAGLVLEATAPVLVGQLLTGGGQTMGGSHSGDPAMLVVPAFDQALEAVPFLVAGDRLSQWAVLVAADGAEVTLDGSALVGCDEEELGELDGDRLVAYTCVVVPGVHVARAPAPGVLVQVYGYSDDTAWAYSGGVGLEQLPPE